MNMEKAAQDFAEGSILTALALVIIFFGFYPQALINRMNVTVNNLTSNYQMDLILNLKVSHD